MRCQPNQPPTPWVKPRARQLRDSAWTTHLPPLLHQSFIPLHLPPSGRWGWHGPAGTRPCTATTPRPAATTTTSRAAATARARGVVAGSTARGELELVHARSASEGWRIHLTSPRTAVLSRSLLVGRSRVGRLRCPGIKRCWRHVLHAQHG